MAKLFLVPINLGGNELLNAAIQNLSTSQRPQNPTTGQIYYDTTEELLMIYDGVQWKSVGEEVTFGTLKTDNDTAQSTSSSESFGNAINLHKVSKTGSYNDLLNLPDLSKKADLDNDGLVPASQLPSYVDDVIELLNLTDTAPSTCAKGDKYYNTISKKIFTATATNTWSSIGEDPEVGKIYVNLTNNNTYRWSGSTLVEISQSTIHKYTGTITGDGTTTSFQFNHGLGSGDCIAQVKDSSNNVVEVDLTITTTTVTVVFSVAPALSTTYTVTIIA